MRVFKTVSVTCTVAFVIAAPVRADTPAETALFKEGARLLADHKDAEALAAFEKAYQIAHSPHALAQMGIAEGALGRWLSADEHLTNALGARQDPWITAHRAPLEQALAAVGKHIGDLLIDGGVAGATVRIDNREYGTLPLPKPIRLVAGSALLQVSAPGRVTVTRRIEIAGGVQSREVVELVNEPAPKLEPVVPKVEKPPETAVVPPVQTEPKKDDDKPKSRTGLLAGIGAAGAVVIGGVTVGLLLGLPNNAPDPSDADLGTQRVRY